MSIDLKEEQPNVESEVLYKTFNFKFTVSMSLSISRLFKMYDSLNKSDYKIWALLYLASPRFRTYMGSNYPSYVSYLNTSMDEYEYNVDNTFSSLLYDIDVEDHVIAGFETLEAFKESNVKLREYFNTEMDMWIKWAFHKHQEENVPVHLLRYIIGTALI